MSPMGMMKFNFLEFSPAFLERNDILSQRRRLDLPFLEIAKLNKVNYTEGFLHKRNARHSVPSPAHTHTYTDTITHMYCTILTSEAPVMHHALPRACSE